MSIEFGGSREEMAGAETGLDNGAEIKPNADAVETITNLENECSQVYDDPDNGSAFDELTAKFVSNFESDPDGWTEWLAELKANLMGEDDPEVIAQVLDDADRASKDLL